MNLQNHPHLCSMSETAGQGVERVEEIGTLSAKVGRQLAEIEDHGDTGPISQTAREIWETAQDWDSEGGYAHQFADEIAQGLMSCTHPEDFDVETRARRSGRAALIGLAMLHRLMARDLTEQADRSVPVPA